MADWLDDFQTDLASGTATEQPTRQAPAKQPTGEPDWLGEFSRDLQGGEPPAEPKKGKIGFAENIRRGGLSGFLDKATLGIKPLGEALELHVAVTRFQQNRYERTDQGWNAKQSDKKKLIGYLEKQAEIAERGLTIPAKVGQIIGDMLPFMAEFLLTGGASALGKKAVSTAVRRLIIRAGGKAAARSLAGRAVPKLAGWVTAAGIRTALTPHRSLKDFIDRRMPDIQISPEGQLIFQEAEESPFRSAYKAIGNQFIEMASEESGAFLGTLAGKITSKILPKGAVTALNKLKNAWIGAGAGRTAQEFAKKMSTKVGFHGVLEEFGEERLGALMRVVAGIDEGEGTTFEKIGRALYPGNEQAFVELIAFSVPGVARGVAAQAFERKTSYSRKEFKELTGKEKSSLAERTEAFEADQAEVAEVPPVEEITAPAVAQEPEIAPEAAQVGVSETEIEALLAEQAAIDAAEGVTDAERSAREAGEVSPEVGVERPPEEGIRVRDVAEVEEAAPKVVVKGKVERPSTPKGLKKPLSMLSDAELESRSKKASPYHKTYLQEIAWRKQQAQPPTEAKPLKQPRKKAVAAKPPAKPVVTPTKPVAEKPEVKEIERAEEEAIIEPTPSPAVEPTEAREAVSRPAPTGKLSPTDPADAREITRLHADFVEGKEVSVGGIFTTTYDKEKREFVVDTVEYTAEQVDAAYRLIQKPIESPMEDVNLFAMPGKEKQLAAIAEKMRRMKPPKKDKKKPRLAKPTALPKAKTKQEDHIKAVNVASASETTRYALNGVLVEGENLVATDGRRMFMAKGKWGKGGIYLDKASLKDGKLGKAEKEGIFPKWQDIVPLVSTRDAIIVDDLDLIWRHIHMASLITTEESKGVTILVNKDGSLGFAAASPEVGHSEINVWPGAKILAGYNPQFLIDAIAFHAKRGDTAIEFYFPEQAERPLLTRSPDGKTSTILMPINLGEVSEELKKTISEGFGAKNIVVTKAQFEKDRAAERAAKPLRGKQKKGLRKGQVRAFTVEDLARAGRFAVFYFEGGLREFQAWSAKLIEIMGEPVKPHLEKLWAQAKKDVEAVEAEKTPEAPKRKKVKSTSKMVQQLARSIAAQGGEIETFNDKLAFDENVSAAQKLVAEERDDAVAIAFGGENKTGISKSSIVASLALQAQVTGNLDEQVLFTELLAEHNLDVGWEGATNKAMMEKYTILEWYGLLKENLVSAVFKPKRSVLRRKIKSAQKVAQEAVNRNVKSAKKAISEGQMKIDSLLSYIESIRC